MIEFYLLIGIISLASWFVSNTLKQKFKKYSQIQLRNGMSGAEIAEKMLSDNGIYDVKVISTPGRLTDHYNPKDKTVNLSESVYNQRNAAAAAVAAHECGHAVQHAKAYSYLTMRSQLVPIVSITSKFSQWLVIGGIILGAASGATGIGFYIAILGLIFMAIILAYFIIRLLSWLQNSDPLKKYIAFYFAIHLIFLLRGDLTSGFSYYIGTFIGAYTVPKLINGCAKNITKIKA